MELIGEKNVVDECIKRWGSEDDRTNNFSENFDNWIESIPESSRDLVLQMLCKFNYYTHKKVNTLLQNLHSILCTKHNPDFNSTIYTNIKSNTGIGNSSNDYWCEYKTINRISKHVCYDDIKKIKTEDWAYISNIIVIDDCSGTGNTFIKYIEYIKEYFIQKGLNLSDKKIYFVVIHIMQDAINLISNYSIENNLNIYIVNSVTQDKAFLSFYSNCELKETFMYDSEKLGIKEKFILGYDNSESLMAFYNNTPNNTIGLFWHNTSDYISIFPRNNDQRPSWQKLKNQKNSHIKQNYNAIARGMKIE